MTLTPGARLSSYEILESIGAGGMGEVYKARDTKLGREVAIKVLPEAFAENTERLARFEREARLLASLNHPNIATIHGLEESAGVHFLVLELVPGETLAERIKRGPIPIDEALSLFKQIAEGLEAAHEKGVIHRDLKPANIKVTPGGKVKVLDFGLAKAMAGEAPVQGLSESPTLTRDATETGVLLGTAPYMSPEQARGKAIDKRTDIWAFGCCLYEALTGKTAFLGETVTDTIAKIVEREPDWQALPPTTPALVRSLLRRCVQKDADHRVHDIADTRIEIEDVLKEPTESASALSAPTSRWRTATRLLSAGLVLTVAVVALWALWQIQQGESKDVVRTSILLPNTQQLYPSNPPGLTISPDGKQVVYVAREDGRRQQLFTRRLGEEESRPIPGTELGSNPFFSPDGDWVGFFSSRGQTRQSIYKVPLDGVGAIPLCVGRARVLGSWGPDDTIIFPESTGSGLRIVSASGGEPEILTTIDPSAGDRSHRYPHVPTDEKVVIFAIHRGGDIMAECDILVKSLEIGESHVLTRGGCAQYVSTGHLVIFRKDTLFAAPFDIERMQLRGTGVPVQTGVADANGCGHFAISQTGTLIYMPRIIVENRLVVVDLQGRVSPLPAPLMSYGNVRFSPDGRRLAISTDDTVYLYELENDRLSVLVSPFNDALGTVWTPAFRQLAWSPDGKQLAFSAVGRGSPTVVFAVPTDGSGEPEQVTYGPNFQFPQCWSPDGERLVYSDQAVKTYWDIWEQPLESGSEPRVIVEAPGDQGHTVFSPDGRWLAYVSPESGKQEVFVKSYNGGGGAYQISADGGNSPVWAEDGKTIYYRWGSKFMSVAVDTTSSFSAGRPRLLFEVDYVIAPRTTNRTHDISPDGKTFVMIRSEGETVQREIRVVLNWFEELKRLVPEN